MRIIFLMLLILISGWAVTACDYPSIKQSVNSEYYKGVTTIEFTNTLIFDLNGIERCSVYYPQNKSIYLKRYIYNKCPSYDTLLNHELTHHWCCQNDVNYKNDFCLGNEVDEQRSHQGCFLTNPIK